MIFCWYVAWMSHSISGSSQIWEMRANLDPEQKAPTTLLIA